MTVPAVAPEPSTQFFKLSDWSKSAHPRATPYPAEWVESRWRPLALTLDRIRLAVGAAITVTTNGGYRNPDHNRAIGGAAKSQHMEGRAADIRAKGMSARKLHGLILKLWEGGALPGLSGIGLYVTGDFVHIDVGGPKPTNGIRRWSGGRKQS